MAAEFITRKWYVYNVDGFLFSSVQYLEDPEVRPHRDAGNIGTSVTVGLGGYSGGALNLDGVAHNIRHSPIHYDGRLLHFVEPFTGNRVSLTFFTHARVAEATLEQRKYLADIGFRLPVASRDASKPLGESSCSKRTPNCMLHVRTFSSPTMGSS